MDDMQWHTRVYFACQLDEFRGGLVLACNPAQVKRIDWNAMTTKARSWVKSLKAKRLGLCSLDHFPEIVVVTSAPHTRRSLLCFRRSFPGEVDVEVFSATDLSNSDEITSPIWMEYLKLAIYYFCARN